MEPQKQPINPTFYIKQGKKIWAPTPRKYTNHYWTHNEISF